MKFLNLLFLLTISLSQAVAESQRDLLVVVGIGGEDPYREQFENWANRWEAAAEPAGFSLHRIGPEKAGEKTLKKALGEKLEELKSGEDELWIVFIGHGSWDGRHARFNLAGDDVTHEELAGMLADHERPLAFVNLTSSSAPFLPAISEPGRVAITATSSGDEANFSHFGQYLSKAIADPESDLDKDNQVSLLEAFLIGARETEAFYKSEQRIQTEHPLIDDNGDKLGITAEEFEGTYATIAPKDKAPDGSLASQFALVRSEVESQLSPEQRAERNRLEREIAALRARRDELPEAEYYNALNQILLQIAEIYESVAAGS